MITYIVVLSLSVISLSVIIVSDINIDTITDSDIYRDIISDTISDSNIIVSSNPTLVNSLFNPKVISKFTQSVSLVVYSNNIITDRTVCLDRVGCL